MNEPEFTFSEPILITTPGGRLTWLKRVCTAIMWCTLVLLVFQGLAKIRENISIFHPAIMTLVIVYSILCHCIRRKIEVSKHGYMELHVLPAVNNTVLHLSADSPIMILDSPARANLRKIQLIGFRSRFTMFITEDESKRLASWTDDKTEVVTYRRHD